MRSHIGYTCVTSLGREFSCVSLNFLPKEMQSHRGRICMLFRLCALSNVFSSYFGQLMHNHISCIYLTSLAVPFPWNCSKKMCSLRWQTFYCLIFPLNWEVHFNFYFSKGRGGGGARGVISHWWWWWLRCWWWWWRRLWRWSLWWWSRWWRWWCFSQSLLNQQAHNREGEEEGARGVISQWKLGTRR